MITTVGTTIEVPAQPLGRLFARFLHFGLLAWGGPVAQIAMLREAFVDEEKWISSAHFNRVLAVYQALPGPEAHEMCVYFGMRSRGRIGGLLAGLGFMLPGFVLMFALSWLYVRYGLDRGGIVAVVFASIQAAVAALIFRAVYRIGRHVLLDPWLWSVAALSFVAQLLGVSFIATLAAGGLIYVCARTARPALALALASACAVMLAALAARSGFALAGLPLAVVDEAGAAHSVGSGQLFWSGLKAGLLTFGGAYTAIPFLQHDAVVQGAWMSNAQFLDGLGLSGLLPAPLIIFATFVGYIGGGPIGALLLTAGIFLPAFAITLVAHAPLERLVHHARLRAFLDGITAAVVGLIAGTALTLLSGVLTSAMSAVIFVLALIGLWYWNSKLAVPLVIAAAALLGGVAHVI
ncbi:MAG TPA: chromate efflux transporter [Steroidobacteraceae bacterium]|nr:chromate efflux transporter [Steroidobacteraceae bacterium]